VGGHSQGSGHACYLAKKHLVDRVLMFSGPNDYSDFYSNSAHWIRQVGETPIEKHFAYLSLNEEIVGFSKQLINLSGLGMLINDDTTYVDNSSAPYGDSHCLYTTQPPGIAILNHNVPVKMSTINNEVWTYMLTSQTITKVNDLTQIGNITGYPNPVGNFIYLSTEIPYNKLKYSIYNSTGQLIKTESVIQTSRNYRIDISDLKKGLYILNVNGTSVKIIKEQ
jgi:hypothetical protein